MSVYHIISDSLQQASGIITKVPALSSYWSCLEPLAAIGDGGHGPGESDTGISNHVMEALRSAGWTSPSI